jgi:D-beta-D-heptose 7-phosphate kinase/D-beta-D-heptose 1-phosphate adenosyltransferase
MKKKVVIVSGYFNPLHIGHLELFRKAKEHGDLLWVIINNDKQRKLKGSKKFMSENERLAIVDAIGIVDFATLSIDKDRTVKETLKWLHEISDGMYELHFANGGDQDNKSILEAKLCKRRGIKLIDGLGNKIQSSSWLLDKK